jgi:hypothetical protein
MPKRPRPTKVMIGLLLADALAATILGITGAKWLS